MDKLVEVRDLNVSFLNQGGPVKVISDLSFAVSRGEVLGIVGESGSGKSVTSLAIMRLLQEEVSQLEGEIFFKDRELLSLSEQDMQGVRGKHIAMIFQEPMTSLNPIHSCGWQITEPLLLHTELSKKEARARALELLTLCGMPDPEQAMRQYPHQLSGGMRQRVMIAMALACDPALLIADEPTTALDVTIQAQILELLKDIRGQRDMGIIFITHDLGIVFDFCDRVAVMYCGELLEKAPVNLLYKNPLHPYTVGLLNALPKASMSSKRLEVIKGRVPDAGQMPEGCRFHPRCSRVFGRCKKEHPSLRTLADGRQVRCFLYDDDRQGALNDES